MSEDKDNIVYIGGKDNSSYFFAIQTQSKINEEIILMARGNYIRKAVDISQISLNNHLTDWEQGEVKLSTVERQSEQEDSPKKISVIEISIKKK